MPLRLTSRDQAILETLTWRIRIAAESQLVSVVGHDNSSLTGFKRRLRALHRAGFVERATIVAIVPILSQPLATWQPGDATPEFGRISWQLRKRVFDSVAGVVNIYWASIAAAKLTGGIGGNLRQPFQMEHDLGTTAVYLHKLATDSAAGWRSEDILRRDSLGIPMKKLPDAVLVDRQDRIVSAIEYGGLYTASRLRRFHEFCSRSTLPYELW